MAADPVPVGHRGLLRHAPENTLAAFAACLDLGMGFELDIRTTKDGQLVVIHDDNVQRTTDGPSRSVRDMTLAEIRRLDAGKWFDEALSGERVPTLEEVLELVSKRRIDRTMIALNVKDVTPQGEATLVKLVEQYDLLEHSFAFDQSDDMSRRLKKLNPAFRIGQNVSRKNIEMRLSEGLLDCFLLTSEPQAEEVSLLHKHGKQALFNFGGDSESRRNPELWKRAAAAGIDGILTDFPLECREVWREAKEDAVGNPSLDTSGVWVETPWGKPVIDRGPAGSWDHLAVDNPYVHVGSETFYCFFEAQDKPFPEGGHEACGIATSQDGIHWTKLTSNPVLSPGHQGAWDDVVAKLPVGVIKRGGLYHLFYSGRNDETKQIGLATANQLTGPWTKSPDNPVLSGRSGSWERVLSTHPAPVFELRGRYHLLYRGMEKRYANQGLGVAVSTDLLHWQRLEDSPVIPVTEEIASLSVAQAGERFVAISQPMDLQKRSYWFSEDLRHWQQGPPVNLRASVKVETMSNPFVANGQWTVLYEQQDRIYRAVLMSATEAEKK
ncbi:MAG: hypothetical protein KDA66_03780 [Planctomycetaceae bacterium]|nr:hypothetical protein [Planctomycetaceae bacterium]